MKHQILAKEINDHIIFNTLYICIRFSSHKYFQQKISFRKYWWNFIKLFL